jgi:formate hydrogenlyase subunit 3/multisubunit Na+/H+ antiporter MnhD subunit
MDAVQLLLLSVLAFGMTALASLLLNRFKRAARITAGCLGAVAAGVGLAAVARAITSASSPFEMRGPLPMGHFSLQLDGLSTLMVGIICALSFAVSIYSMSYLGRYPNFH